MTKEEAAVINAAIKVRRDSFGLPTFEAWEKFRTVVDALICSCIECNNDTHRCPGCGRDRDIQHTETACAECHALHAEDTQAVIDTATTEWVSATFTYVLISDRIRLGNDEATITWSSVSTWHADNTDPYRPKSWKHIETRFTLDPDYGLPAKSYFKPNTSVDILMNQERLAIHRWMLANPGSSILERPADA